MALSVDIKINGLKELQKQLNILPERLKEQLSFGMDLAASNAAEDIKVTFKGGTSPGFEDRSFALRESIVGGLDDSNQTDDIVGFIGAGDDTVGSNGKRTREYVNFIEFGEFSNAGNTSFLRAGAQRFKGQIKDDIVDSMNVERLIG